MISTYHENRISCMWPVRLKLGRLEIWRRPSNYCKAWMWWRHIDTRHITKVLDEHCNIFTFISERFACASFDVWTVTGYGSVVLRKSQSENHWALRWFHVRVKHVKHRQTETAVNRSQLGITHIYSENVLLTSIQFCWQKVKQKWSPSSSSLLL